MSRPALNLLRQPLASPWTGLWPAALSGVWLGGALGLACQWQLPALLQAQAERQQLVAAQAQQQRRLNAQRHTLARQAAAQQEVQTRWRQQQRWHDALAALATEQGLRVQRWQGDAQQLQLQAWLPQAQLVPEVLAALNAAGPGDWRLQRLSHNAGHGVWLSLHAPLPAPLARATPAGAEPPASGSPADSGLHSAGQAPGRP